MALLLCVCVGTATWSLGAPWIGFLAAPVLSALAYRRYRGRRAEIERNHALQAQLSIYRVAETLANADGEQELIRQGLEAIATGTGVPHWALYLHRSGRGEFAVAATRGLPEGAEAELLPDAVGPDARSPASRAAWLGEMQIARDPGSVPEWRFPARTEGLGPRPAVISIPLADQGDLPAVLQCFLPGGSALEPERGALLRWIGAQLVSGLKRLRLEHRDQLLASYMMSTGEIFLGLDLTGEITHANAAAEQALGAVAGALVGIRLDQLAVLADPGAKGATLFDMARSAGEFSGLIWFVRGDGTRFPAEVRLSAALDRLRAMVLVGRDVTDRHEQEQDLRGRTREVALVNEKLQAVNRELEEAQRLQNDYLANLEQNVHKTEEEGREFARSIRESAEHLLGVINDLLDLAKVAAGRLELRLVHGDLRPAIESAVEAIRPLAAQKGLKLLVDNPVEFLDVALDPARMRQVLLNVLGNAVKFTDKGEVRVRAWRDEATEETRVSVEDTGVGIAPEQHSRLFRKFSQVDSSYRRRHSGTGLGLVITQALVKNMGGTISVESEGLNRGTRVTLAFPATIGSRAGAT
ncbi:MAG: PAS domain-containing protein [Chloroflexi bacterium]|nr:MAG: PAS domain-containing protein [Chloroflexota bacterium]